MPSTSDARGADSGERRHRSHRHEHRRSRSPDSDRRRHDKERNRERDQYRDSGRKRERSPDGRHSHRRRQRSRERDSTDERKRDKQLLLEDRKPLPSQEASFAVENGEEVEKPKEKPNFKNSGALAAASNVAVQADGSTVTLKYHEPPEARKPSPKDQWRLFVFKGKDIVDTVDLGSRSCWLVGRAMDVVDLPAEHPSISKQHAVIQFRYIEKTNEYGEKTGKVKPYLIDLESANGTILNDSKIPDSRYLELRHKDMIQFGDSTREYVVMLAPK